MKRQESEILHALLLEPFINQRILSEICGCSLGVVNRSIKNLIMEGFLDARIRPTDKAYQELENNSPKNAIILAAGFGMRMVPINLERPKAFMEIHGEPLIERIIKQLHEVGITEIYIVVGFMKEQFEYLIDEFHVELIFNPFYASRNNLHSMSLVTEYLSNTYIIPCDVWCNRNPFHRYEFCSWYMVSDLVDDDSTVRVNRKMELVTVSRNQSGNAMIGITYLTEEKSHLVRKSLKRLDTDRQYEDSFWEKALYDKGKMIVPAKVVHTTDVVEINTYEQLRELDEESNHLKSDAISIITQILRVTASEIVDITVLKKGMTNRCFLFTCKNKKYIMRIPGEGTDQLINRQEEAAVYKTIKEKNLCDNIIYINPENGYKITEFFPNARVCDPNNQKDLTVCMKKLREFHQLQLSVNHEFDIFKQIEFYETLWNGEASIYKDYFHTKKKVLSLQPYINQHIADKCLTHIDAVPDNFLFVKDSNGTESVRLIDWEYAGMQDPHVDLAMFCIYSLYDKEQIDHLIDIYFENNCGSETRVKIYCYIAAGGLLWSNWCEYKRNLGIEFGEYSLRQYRYAKDYYKIAMESFHKDFR
ncbi:MAG: NTP transferase domain-containing protein [Lachnospiraceae bacterium]|nr:NTP transferase domain-containing protein [Lachnospiraceae bacterium]